MNRRDPDNARPAAKRLGAVTMTTVGRLAGVSQVTVSRALSDPSKVSPETLKRIHDAIETTGFVPNALAGALASRKSNLITALVPSITNIVYSSLLQGFSELMRQHGYQLMLAETGFDPVREQQMIATLLARRPDGILLTGIHHTPEARRMLIGADIPVVEVWDVTETPIDCCVGFSHQAVGRDAADFAAGAGYVRAATVTAGDLRAVRRRDSFIERFTVQRGGPVARVDYPPGTATLGDGRAALADLIERQGFLGGVIFCSSDQYAQGVITEANARGLRVPQDIAVIGFGDQAFAEHTWPSITTIRVDRDTLGVEAANALLDRFGGGPAGPATIDLGFTLIRRESA